MVHRAGPREGHRIDDIVRAAGVSRSTVFRYFAGSAVRPQAAAAIERALSVLQPTAPAGGQTRHDFLVSVLPGYQRFRGYADVMDGMLQRTQESGASVRIGTWQEGDPLPRGVVILGKTINDEDAESAEWKKQGVPCVLLNRIPEEPDRSWVAVDCRLAAREAVEHLLAQGCRRIAAWCDESTRVARDKLQGYRDAVLSAGISPDPALEIDSSRARLEETFALLMDRKDPPDGWFSADDENAVRVMSLAASRGVAVPRDLALIGMNDSASAPHLVPALSSVRLPFQEMGVAAIDCLNRLIDYPMERSVRILLAHRLVVRDSSRRM